MYPTDGSHTTGLDKQVLYAKEGNIIYKSEYHFARRKMNYKKINIIKAITIDFFTLNEYINNNYISELIKNYIILCFEIKDNDDISKFNITRKMKNNLKDEILELLINISYIEFDKYIRNKYKPSNYIIYNFNSEQTYHQTKDYMFYINFNKYLTELRNKSLIPKDWGNRISIRDRIKSEGKCDLFNMGSSDIYQNDSLACITLKGDLWYTSD